MPPKTAVPARAWAKGERELVVESRVEKRRMTTGSRGVAENGKDAGGWLEEEVVEGDAEGSEEGAGGGSAGVPA